MSFHILHLLEHGSYLSKRRGRLVYEREGESRSLPIENVKAVIVAAKGITFSDQLISALLSHDTVILHCDQSYQPVGMTAPFFRTMNNRLLEGQIRPTRKFIDSAWKLILYHKVSNQAAVLDSFDDSDNPLYARLQESPINEGHCARIYWRCYFKEMDEQGVSRAQRHTGALNASLNYGYAVLNALVHRSLVVHGLLPSIGIQHKPRFRSYPLVYDLMEPLRPIVDALTGTYYRAYRQLAGMDSYIKDYGQFIGKNLRSFRVPHKRYSLKLLDAIDFYVRSYANGCENQDVKSIWVPEVSGERLYQVAKAFKPKEEPL